MIVCNTCKIAKNSTDFPPSKLYLAEANRAIYCNACCSAYHKKWYAKRKNEPYWDKRRITQKESSWKFQYNLSRAEYESLFEKQGGVCAICKKPETRMHKGQKRHLSVDHCHETGKIRGLLCDHCNTGIGKFFHNTSLLSSAIDYLN